MGIKSTAKSFCAMLTTYDFVETAAPWSAESVGYFIQSVLQGAFIFAKAKQGPEVVRESLAHLRRYLGLIFNQPRSSKRKVKP
jgi:hypothetical protein